MTHMLHRVGTEESLNGDYCFLMLAATPYNHEDAGPKMQRFYEIVARHNPVNVGDVKRGNRYTLGDKNLKDNIIYFPSGVHAIFDNEEDAAAALKDLKEEDMGLSLVVSGIFKKVKDMCIHAGIHRHALLYSLGVWGKTEKLPSKEIQQLTSMCGHGMIGPNLVKHLIAEIKKGKKTAEQAAIVLAKQCCCGIVNPTRATKLLTELTSK